MKIIELETWTDIQSEFNKFNPVRNSKFGGYDRIKDFYIFRGHQFESWNLSSTIERKQLYDSLENIFHEFQQKVSLLHPNRVTIKSTLEKTSLMRHYGVPSPLVDFTFSPYIALFFAFSNFLEDEYSFLSQNELRLKMEGYQNNNCALYSLNYYNLNKLDGIKRKLVYEKYLMQSEDEFEKFFNSTNKGIRAFLPSKYNIRISHQQGLFLSQSRNPKTDFHTELVSKSENIRLTKYIIPHKLTLQILYELNKMNINSSTMFPDLDGLGSHVAFKEKLRLLSPLFDITKLK